VGNQPPPYSPYIFCTPQNVTSHAGSTYLSVSETPKFGGPETPSSLNAQVDSPRRGNNVYGAAGIYKCLKCRLRKGKCQYKSSKDACRFCVDKGLECGAKIKAGDVEQVKRKKGRQPRVVVDRTWENLIRTKVAELLSLAEDRFPKHALETLDYMMLVGKEMKARKETTIEKESIPMAIAPEIEPPWMSGENMVFDGLFGQ